MRECLILMPMGQSPICARIGHTARRRPGIIAVVVLRTVAVWRPRGARWRAVSAAVRRSRNTAADERVARSARGRARAGLALSLTQGGESRPSPSEASIKTTAMRWASNQERASLVS